VMRRRSVSMPSDSGVTSRSSMSLTSPVMTPPWTAAPTATTSSGLTPLCGSLPKYSRTSCCTFGIRVEPPTSTTSSIFFGSTPASASACFTGAIVRCRRSSTSCSSFARVSFICRCFGPLASAVTNGRVVSLFLRLGALDLRFLRAFLQPRKRHPILRQIDAVALPELGREPLDDAVIEIVAAQMRVAVGRLHFDHALAHLEDRDVERAAAEVVYGDCLVLLLVEAVGERGRGRLVDDAKDVQA